MALRTSGDLGPATSSSRRALGQSTRSTAMPSMPMMSARSRLGALDYLRSACLNISAVPPLLAGGVTACGSLCRARLGRAVEGSVSEGTGEDARLGQRGRTGGGVRLGFANDGLGSSPTRVVAGSVSMRRPGSPAGRAADREYLVGVARDGLRLKSVPRTGMLKSPGAVCVGRSPVVSRRRRSSRPGTSPRSVRWLLSLAAERVDDVVDRVVPRPRGCGAGAGICGVMRGAAGRDKWW